LVSPNVTFSLCAATGALLVSTLSAAKGRWAVAIVFGMLVLGFLLRALEGRRETARDKSQRAQPTEPPAPAEPAVVQQPTRRVKPARFKRR
jgi:hypothetical protein